MKKVLFICYGNIMRSQIAEAYYNHFTNSSAATSAGTDSYTPQHYKHPAAEVIAVMEEEGIDLKNKRVKQVTPEMVDAADEIYVLTSRGDCPSYLADSPKATYWQVSDPYGADMETFRHTRDLIKEHIHSLLISQS